jgi:hypothetical protein
VKIDDFGEWRSYFIVGFVQMDGTNIFYTINNETSSMPTFLVKLLQASALDTFFFGRK